jgi:peptidoglycan/xylan/chitin deacetylase (PgdA/CDA1 family)
LLDVLRANGVHATFFLLGQNVERDRATIVRMAREGHVLGNHSWTHPKAGAISEAAFVDEIRRTDALLGEISPSTAKRGRAREGGPRVVYPVRLPYGPQPNDPRLRALASLGRTHVHWTSDFQDWTRPPPDPSALAAAMRSHVAAQHAAGLDAVLDLHDSSRLFEDRGATAEAVRLLLEGPALDLFTVPVGS